ncbi:hypothetical protein DDB_G0267220 [Dictyostelium discoideum AX4]|uniref:Uncharacterized protein n=1 Tax=Dictyostelium discoideum TaxID=44689 RepID=Q55H64_DICDI|nr:hypothetical protein DDB_G0267220 [Dictyostelium discoideum AX4]EAL73847.1 hypothetical protein DDB_G0267220 [Dictyostelium discoideum AX4]|eukprot:XP_647771.1 hypothetical protein DDB_G0267220 [Dictyostelium discoideum AX4]
MKKFTTECFICNCVIEFSAKTIELIQEHVHKCINVKLDENEIERFPTIEQFNDKQKQIEELSKKVEELTFKLNFVE